MTPSQSPDQPGCRHALRSVASSTPKRCGLPQIAAMSRLYPHRVSLISARQAWCARPVDTPRARTPRLLELGLLARSGPSNHAAIGRGPNPGRHHASAAATVMMLSGAARIFAPFRRASFNPRNHQLDQMQQLRCRTVRIVDLVLLPSPARAGQGTLDRSRCRHSPIPTIPRRQPSRCSAARRSPLWRRRDPIGFHIKKGCLARGQGYRSAADLANGRLAQSQLGYPDLIKFLGGCRQSRQGQRWPGSWSATCRSRAATDDPAGMPVAEVDSTTIQLYVQNRADEEREEIIRLYGEDGRRRGRSTPDGRAEDPFRGDQGSAGGPAGRRIFVSTAIKEALCREAGTGASWLGKVHAVVGA